MSTRTRDEQDVKNNNTRRLAPLRTYATAPIQKNETTASYSLPAAIAIGAGRGRVGGWPGMLAGALLSAAGYAATKPEVREAVSQAYTDTKNYAAKVADNIRLMGEVAFAKTYPVLSSYFYPEENPPADNGQSLGGTTSSGTTTNPPTTSSGTSSPAPTNPESNGKNDKDKKNISKHFKPFSGYRGGSWYGNLLRGYRDAGYAFGGFVGVDLATGGLGELGYRYITDKPIDEHRGATGWIRHWINGYSPKDNSQNGLTELREAILPDGTRVYLTPGDSLQTERTQPTQSNYIAPGDTTHFTIDPNAPYIP